jgi:WD40 repeat protein
MEGWAVENVSLTVMQEHFIERDRLLNGLTSSLSPTAQSPPGEIESHTAPSIPDHEMIRCIGRGSYGEVWLARSVMGQWRAVKIVYRRSFDNDRPYERELEGIRRFEPVSRTHPSQLHVLHVGRNDADRFFYYVMELADPVTPSKETESSSEPKIVLETYVPRTLRSEFHFRGRLPFQDCVSIAMALATALDHLHKHGLVHRDIKPSNIIFVQGIPKLADIGLVAIAEATLSVVGTEGYLPPEGPGTPLADIYSLGKVLYEMATGLDRHQYPELPIALLRQADRNQLTELNEIIVKACQTDARHRYRTAADMHADLAFLSTGGSIRRQRAMSRNLRIAQHAGALVTALALLVGGGWFYQSRQTQALRELATEKTFLAEQNRLQALKEKRSLAENRERVARLSVARGLREAEEGNATRPLLWLADALRSIEPNPERNAVHRIRLNWFLSRHPRLLEIFPHPAPVLNARFGPGENLVVTACADGVARVWQFDSVEKPIAEFHYPGPVVDAQFLSDGDRLLITGEQGFRLLDYPAGTCLLERTGNITVLALSPDGQQIAAAQTNSVVELISPADAQPRAFATTHQQRINNISFSSDSRRLLTASDDGTARTWDADTMKSVGPVLHAGAAVQLAVLSPDGQTVATATKSSSHINLASSTRCEFQFWAADSGKPVGRPISGLDPPRLLRFDATGQRIFMMDDSSRVQVWSRNSRDQASPPLETRSKGRCLDLSPDGRLVVIGSEDGGARLWDLETGLLSQAMVPNTAGTEATRFSQDGSRLLTASQDGTVKLWDLTGTKPIERRLDDVPFQIAASRDGKRLLISERDRSFWVWDSATLETSAGPYQTPGAASLVQVSPGGTTFATASGWARQEYAAPFVWLYSMAGEAVQKSGELPHPAPVFSLQFSPDGEQLATLCRDRRMRIWRVPETTLLNVIEWPAQELIWFQVSPDLRTVAAVLEDGSLQLRDVQSGESRGSVDADLGRFVWGAFCPDGRVFAAVGENRKARVYDVTTGNPITAAFTLSGNFQGLLWNQAGSRLLSADGDATLDLWYARTVRRAMPSLKIETLYLPSLAFSPDDRFFCAATVNSLLRIWDAKTGEALLPAIAIEGRKYAHPRTVFPNDESLVVASESRLHNSYGGVVSVISLTPETNSVSSITDYARLLSGYTLYGSGDQQPLSAYELATLHRGLRQRVPAWFRSGPELLKAWHGKQSRDPATLTQLDAALFHLAQLKNLDPQDASLDEQLERVRAKRIQPRAPGLPGKLLDLTPFYTDSLELLPRQDYALLPRGYQVLAGTEFDIRGMIWLEHKDARAHRAGTYQERVFIPVGQRCQTVHFLQASDGGFLKDGTVVGRWIFHYQDGSLREWPVAYGKHLRDWWWFGFDDREATDAVTAWRSEGDFPIYRQRGEPRLFKASWTNPQPELELETIELKISESPAYPVHPLIVAITLE